MKVLLVNGSGHAKGCTYTALEEVAGALEKNGIETEIIQVGVDPIAGCIGCGACLKTGKCFREDGVNEFVEKALRFYMGYLATEDTSEYLSRAMVDTLRGTLADDENRLRTLLFKLCVEVNMMGHTVAAHFRADPVNRRELRAYAVDEVLRTNGKIRFDDAIDLQRQVYPDG